MVMSKISVKNKKIGRIRKFNVVEREFFIPLLVY
jgi:hypothetical protein